jgi:hypothetical protein
LPSGVGSASKNAFRVYEGPPGFVVRCTLPIV